MMHLWKKSHFLLPYSNPDDFLLLEPNILFGKYGTLNISFIFLFFLEKMCFFLFKIFFRKSRESIVFLRFFQSIFTYSLFNTCIFFRIFLAKVVLISCLGTLPNKKMRISLCSATSTNWAMKSKCWMKRCKKAGMTLVRYDEKTTFVRLFVCFACLVQFKLYRWDLKEWNLFTEYDFSKKKTFDWRKKKTVPKNTFTHEFCVKKKKTNRK